jgi:hypothetical protein
VSIDGLAFEPQFLAHIAPVWRALPDRGVLRVHPNLVDRAAALGLVAEPVDPAPLRRTDPPKARPGDGPIAFAASIGDIKIGRRLGYRRFVFIEHGAGQAYLGDKSSARHPSYAGGADREDVVLFLVPNEYSAALWRRAYPNAQVEVVGSPRLDDLPARQLPHLHPTEDDCRRETDEAVEDGRLPGACFDATPTVAISFHWPAFVAPESGTAFGHYQDALPELARRFAVIGHAHPKGDWPERMARKYRAARIPFVPDFDDVCRQADVYVCDNSSTLFEFAATGRPVVVLNAPQYRRNVHHGLRFWDAAHVGVQVDHPRDLIAGIERALEHRSDDVAAREDALETVYAYRHGAAERAAAAITDHLSVPVAA